MTTVKVYDLEGNEVDSKEVNAAIAEAKTSKQVIKDYIVAIRNNARQWSANTKGRSEVKHTTRKPHRQKGTGNARQGSLVAPQFRGGGVVFGPKPKFDQHVRINKKEKRAAIRALLAEKLVDEKVILIQDSQIEAPKTKFMANFMKKNTHIVYAIRQHAKRPRRCH